MTYTGLIISPSNKNDGKMFSSHHFITDIDGVTFKHWDGIKHGHIWVPLDKDDDWAIEQLMAAYKKKKVGN